MDPRTLALPRRQALLALLLAAAAAAGLPRPAAGAEPQRPLQPARPGAALSAMVAFDGTYIPALAATSAASLKPEAAPAAVATMQALVAEWPALRSRLAPVWGATPPARWVEALQDVDRRIGLASQATLHAKWSEAHEELEGVRVELMEARRSQGFDYFVDRLTEYHEPMEVLALAGALKPASLTAERRGELARAYQEARALWAEIERFAVPAEAYGLSSGRQAQMQQGMAQERVALDALGQALQGDDAARLLQAAAAIKPPFARLFTAFGQPAH